MQCVAILPDGTEYFGEVTGRVGSQARDVAEAAVRKAKLTTSRKNPVEVTVQVYQIAAKDGELTRRSIGEIVVMPTLERMTQEEYTEEMESILSDLPEEFRLFVSQQSWEEGHSAGYEEVVNYAQDYAYSLASAIKAYNQRMGI